MEAGLREVMIGGQRLGECQILHHHKGDAVRERPRFVHARGEQIAPASQQVIGGRDDSEMRGCANVSVCRQVIATICWLTKAIPQLQ